MTTRLVSLFLLLMGCSSADATTPADPNAPQNDGGSNTDAPGPQSDAPTTVSCGVDRMTDWVAVHALPEARTRAGVTVNDGTIYVIGGQPGTTSAFESTAYVKPSADGTIASPWAVTTGTLVSGGVEAGIAFAYQSKLHLIGGHQGGQFANIGNDVFHEADVQPGGDVKSWFKSQGKMTLNGARGALIDDQIFVYGGTAQQGAPIVANVAYSIDAKGQLAVSGIVPPTPGGIAYHEHAMVAAKGHLYVLGGTNNAGGAGVVKGGDPKALPMLLDPNAGAWWTSLAPLPHTFSNHAATAFDDQIVITGGAKQGAGTTEVWAAHVLADGSLGPWAQGKSLPTGVYDHGAVRVGDYLYVVGGSVDSQTSSDKVYMTRFCR